MRLDEYRKQILDVPSIHALPPELKSRIAMILLWIGHEAEVPSGSVIYSQGAEDEDTGCVLVSGSVQVSVRGETIKVCDAPEILGEMKQFTEAEQRTATVRASTDACILTFYWRDLVMLNDTVFSSEDQVAIREVITKVAGFRLKEHPR